MELSLIFFFFFQAEDGIRDATVTGVQTCALPISCPAGEFCSPHGRPARQCLDPGRVSTFRTSESRPDWVPSLPRGPAVLSRPVRSLRPPLAPSSGGQALSPRRSSHLPGLSITRRHQGFTCVHPPGLPPRLQSPDGTRTSWACSLGFAPQQAGPAGARQGGGRASSTHPELHDRHDRTSNPQARSQCATSCRTTGPDMTRFPTPGHLASWAGRTPLDNSSGQRKGKAKAKKGNRYLAAVTGETAVAAGKTQTREGARYRRLARRRGKPKAQVALGNTQLKVYHALLSRPGTRYQDPGPDYYERQRDPRRQIAHHVGKLGALGFEVTPCRIPQPDPDPAGAGSQAA